MQNKLTCLMLLQFAAASGVAFADVAQQAKSSGVKGGIVVHLGCGDGTETAKLLLDEKFLVHGLDADEANVERARKNLQDLNLYGKVSVARLDARKLPYVDNLVNMVIDSSGEVPQEEILRVLVPGGVAYIDGKKIVKPAMKEIDQWTHFLHGPDNNAVAKDSKVDMPRSIQWVAGPRWGRSHEELASMSAAVTAKGRIFFIIDEAPLASIRFMGNWKLIARDAFNGTLLWKRNIPLWNDHLRHFRSGPTHLPRRLVAVGDTVYMTDGLAGPVLALDAATGNTIRTYDGTERTEEIIVDNGVLYLVVGTSEVTRQGGGLHRRGEPEPTDFRYISAVDATSGKQLWKYDSGKNEFILPVSLTVKGPNVFCQTTKSVTCLDATSGKQRWKTPRATLARRMGFSSPTVVATDEGPLVADRSPGEKASQSTGSVEWGVHGWNVSGYSRTGRSTLQAYSVADGKELWSTECNENYNSAADVFVIDGLVWTSTGYAGRDLKTGEVVRTISVKGDKVGMPHHRCYRNKASERFIFTGRSGIEVHSIEDGWQGNNSWIRGTCQYGILPANGLLYAPPDACACYLPVKAPGFFAAAPQRDATGKMPFPGQPVLEKGPAYGRKLNAKPAKADDWPMYRQNNARGGAVGSSVPDKFQEKWSAKIGGKLTQPIIAGGTVYVAAVDAHTLYALSEEDGKELWTFTADGRIDSSPTVYKGTILFGSADGWVYCLDAADGQLVWRFRAAPEERLVGVYGQLESIWPVHGAVLVQNETLYLTAGRSTYLDGGIVLYRIEPKTGKPLSRTVVYHLDPETGKQLVSESRFSMDGTTSDILSGDGESVFMKHYCFDRLGKRMKAEMPHMFAITGFLGSEWFVRSYWVFAEKISGAGWGGWASTAAGNPSGRILCFDGKNVYGYGRERVASGPTGHRADAYHLYSAAKKKIPSPPSARPLPADKTRTGGKSKRRNPQPRQPANKINWSVKESLTVRAMALAGDRLVVAGPVDAGKKTSDILAYENAEEALATFEGKKEIYLRTVSTVDGKKVFELKLSAMPVFDGMSSAGGKVFVSFKDGTVSCFGTDMVKLIKGGKQ